MTGTAQAWVRYDSGRSISRRMPLLSLLPLLLAVVASAGNTATLFEEDAVLGVTLSGPLSSLVENPESRNELPFVLTAAGMDHAIMVRVRGRSRLKVCQFPPLRLRFTDDDTTETGFAGPQTLKLVTHCRSGSAYATSVVREYAAYRIFNLLSEVGYRVRLLNITYRDTDEGLKETTFTRYGFLVEPATSLAARTDGQIAEVCGVSIASLDQSQAAVVFIFQFLIGNTDWSLVPSEDESCCCHNIDLIDIGSSRFGVPFDFDLSGLVNARYARPNPVTGLSRVTQRRYRGYCLPAGSLAPAVRHIKEHKTETLSVIRNLPGLSTKDRNKSLAFLERFFARADDEDKLLRSFERRCLH